MRLRLYGTAILGLGLALGAIGEASATVCQSESPAGTTSPDYTCFNGTETYPGTYVGTVGSAAGDVTEIGNLTNYNSGSGGAFVNPTNNPSNYEFYWGGGNLMIVGEVGNNGTESAGINMELDSYNNGTSSGGTETLVAGASIHFPQNPDFTPQTLIDENLLAGYYTLSTYAGAISTDPNYQATFSFPTSVPAIPEPSSLAVLVVALAGLPLFARRRKA